MSRVYIGRPVRVEAIQFLPGKNCNCVELDEFLGVTQFCFEDDDEGCPDELEYYYTDPASGDEDFVEPRGWIVRHSDGSLNSFTNENFTASYKDEKWLR